MDITRISTTALLITSMMACLICGILRNLYSKKYVTGTEGHYLLSAITSAVCAFTIFAMNNFQWQASGYTIVLALIFGIVTMLATILQSQALSLGPWSYTSVIGSCSTVITALSGYLIWNEQLGSQKLIGISLMVACLSLSTKKEKEKEKKSLTSKWFVTAVLSAVAVAGIGMLQKVHQESTFKDELVSFLVIAFIVSFFASLGAYFVCRKQCSRKTDNRKSVTIIGGIFVISGICIAINNYLNLYLSGAMDAAVFFPIVNGGGLVLNVLAGMLLFRERLIIRQWIGIFLGIIATLLLCI